MKVIFFPIENYSREVDARLGIVRSIKKNKIKNYIFIIIPKNFLTEIIKKSHFLCTIFHKSLQEHFLKVIKKIISYGSKVTFIEEEYFDAYSDADIRFGKEPSIISCAFASTLQDYKSLKSRINKKKVIFSGNPRIDIIKNIKWLYSTEILDLKKKYGNFILLNSNFSYINNPRDHNLENLKNTEFTNNPEGFNELKSYIEDHKKRYKKLVFYLKNSTSFDKFDNIVYRCHPNESKIKAKKEFKDSRVKVISEDNVLIWIKACQCILHCACTTSIEAFLMGKESIFFEPFDSERNNLSFYTSKNLIINDSIFSNNNFIKENKKFYNLINSQLPKHQLNFQNNSNFPACDTIAKWLDLNTPDSNSFNFYLKFFYSTILSIPRIFLIMISEKEKCRININLRRSINKFNLKTILISNFLGFAIII